MLNTAYNEIIPLVVEEAKKRGYKYPSAIISQFIQESGSTNLSTLASKYHNYAGLKAGSKWTGKVVNMKTKEEYTVGTMTTITDGFRVFDTVLDGVRGYFDFISTKRYENLKNATSPEDYLAKIKADGYCTSSTYVEHTVRNLSVYNLKQYDTDNDYAVVKPTPKIDRKNSIKLAVISIQKDLNAVGYHLAEDGIFGPKTMEAYNKYRRS